MNLILIMIDVKGVKMEKINPREKLVLMLILLAIRAISNYSINNDLKEDMQAIKDKLKKVNEE